MEKQKVDPRPGGGLVKPDSPAVLLHDALADGQADAAARVFLAAVQSFEETEDSLSVLSFNSNPVIADGKHTPAVTFDSCDRDTREPPVPRYLMALLIRF